MRAKKKRSMDTLSAFGLSGYHVDVNDIFGSRVVAYPEFFEHEAARHTGNSLDQVDIVKILTDPNTRVYTDYKYGDERYVYENVLLEKGEKNISNTLIPGARYGNVVVGNTETPRFIITAFPIKPPGARLYAERHKGNPNVVLVTSATFLKTM